MTTLTLQNRLTPEKRAQLQAALPGHQSEARDILDQASPQDEPTESSAALKDKSNLAAPVPQAGDQPQEVQTRPAKIKAVHDWLLTTWPQVFDLQNPRPLKLNIQCDLFAQRPDTLTKTQIRLGLRAYVDRPAYLQAVIIQGWRLDLTGQPVQAITAAQQAYSQQRLQDKQHRHKTRRHTATKRSPDSTQ